MVVLFNTGNAIECRCNGVGADVSVMKKSQCTTPSSYTTCSAPTLQTIKISTLDVFKRNTAVKDTEI